MAFPVSPTNNQTAVVNGIVYLYSSADNTWSRFSTPPGNLSVTSNLTSSGNLIASNVYLSSLYWANGVPVSLTGTYSNTNVAAYLTTGTIAITDLSVGDSLIQQDALNLNNNNLYNVNTIRINDPGPSEGIAWEGGSGWNIYESPNDLSNNTGNLQIVLSGVRALTVDTNQTVNIPSTWEAISVSTGALTVGGGVGIGGNLWVGGNIYTSNLVSVGTTTLSVQDPLLYLTTNTLVPYNYDIGFFSHFIGGSLNNYQHTGFSRNYSDNTWTLFSNVFADPGITINWTEANIIYDPIKVGSANIANTTVSTSTTTGALVVGGGAGIGGALYIANAGDVSANIGTLFLDSASINANLGAFQTYANANISTLFLGNASTQANLGTLYLSDISTQANLGAFQTYANANIGLIRSDLDTLDSTVAALFTGNVSTNANLGAFQEYANANIGTLYLSNISTNANLGAFQTYANANIGLASVNFDAFRAYANTKIGNNADSNLVIRSTTTSTSSTTGALVVAGGIGVAGNVVADKFYTTNGLYWAGNGVAFSSGGGGSGTPAGSNQQIQYNNGGVFGASSGLVYDGVSLKVNGNLESTYHSGDEGGEIFLAKPDTNTTLAAGVTIDIFQNKLRFFENGGTNRGYYLDITSGGAVVGTNIMSGGGGGSPAGSTGDVQFNNGGALGATSLFYDSATGNLVLTDTTTSTSTTTGAFVVKGGVGVAGNVVADKFYTTNGLYWSGNGVAFSSGGGGGASTLNDLTDVIISTPSTNQILKYNGSAWINDTNSGGGGGGITYTSDTAPPLSPNIADQWYNTVTDVLYEYIEDGTSSYWVDVQSPMFSSGITNSVVGNVSITGPTSSIGHLTVARTATVSGNIITLSNINVAKSANVLGNLTVGGNVAFSRDATIAANLTVVGNVAAGNITTANITATGNITTVETISSTIVSAANITVTSNVTTANITATNINSTANITSGNIATGNLTVTSNIISSELTSSGNITANNVTITGNATLTGANVYVGNVANLSIGGGTSGQYLQTDGAGDLTWQTLPATNIQEFTATASQTTFTVVGTYTVGSVLVFVNGIQMNSIDYTATDGTTVVLTEPRNVGDTVRIIASFGAASLVSGLTLNVNNLQNFAVAMSIALGA